MDGVRLFPYCLERSTNVKKEELRKIVWSGILLCKGSLKDTF